MRALHAVRTAPVRAAVRLETLRADGGDVGMTTAEYAVGTVAACGFGGVLVAVLKDPSVQDMIKNVLLGALKLAKF